MKTKLPMAIILTSLFTATLLFAQSASPTTTTKPLSSTVKPTDPIKGFIARVYNRSGENPTNVVCVVQTGKEFNKFLKAKAADELRGIVKDMDLFCVANGYIILDKDTEVAFDINGCDVLVNRKEFGSGTYVKKLPKGKYPIEISRAHGKGQIEFKVSDSNSDESVVFYTNEMLSRELSRSLRVDRKVLKSKLIEQ